MGSQTHLVFMTAVVNEDSTRTQSVFGTLPPSMVQIQGDIVNLSGRLGLTMSCAGNHADCPHRYSDARAVFNPVSETRHRAYVSSFFVAQCWQRGMLNLRFSLSLALNSSYQIPALPPGDLPRNPETTYDSVFFNSPPVAFVDRWDNKAILPDIRCCSKVAFWLRDPGATVLPLKKYMSVSDGKFYATTSRWSRFKIAVVPETETGSPHCCRNDAVFYGSTVVLTDVDTGIRSRPYVVYEARLDPGNGSVKELHSLAFHRKKEDGSSLFFTMSKPEDASVYKSPLIDEGPTPLNAGYLFTRASWSIVSIRSFSLTFFDLFSRLPSTGLSPIITNFPAILEPPKMDVINNAIYARISNYFYTDEETGKLATLDVWLGTKGPLPTDETAIDGE
jgi:hypothetical protein